MPGLPAANRRRHQAPGLMPSIRELEEEITGQDALTPAEHEAWGRAVSKGYAEPWQAYRVGIRDGLVARAGSTDIDSPVPGTDS